MATTKWIEFKKGTPLAGVPILWYRKKNSRPDDINLIVAVDSNSSCFVPGTSPDNLFEAQSLLQSLGFIKTPFGWEVSRSDSNRLSFYIRNSDMPASFARVDIYASNTPPKNENLVKYLAARSATNGDYSGRDLFKESGERTLDVPGASAQGFLDFRNPPISDKHQNVVLSGRFDERSPQHINDWETTQSTNSYSLPGRKFGLKHGSLAWRQISALLAIKKYQTGRI